MLEKALERIMQGAYTPMGRIVAILLVLVLSLTMWNGSAPEFALAGESGAEQAQVSAQANQRGRGDGASSGDAGSSKDAGGKSSASGGPAAGGDTSADNKPPPGSGSEPRNEHAESSGAAADGESPAAGSGPSSGYGSSAGSESTAGGSAEGDGSTAGTGATGSGGPSTGGEASSGSGSSAGSESSPSSGSPSGSGPSAGDGSSESGGSSASSGSSSDSGSTTKDGSAASSESAADSSPSADGGSSSSSESAADGSSAASSKPSADGESPARSKPAAGNEPAAGDSADSPDEKRSEDELASDAAAQAKKETRRVRIVIEPGADNVHMDNQAMTFCLDYGERIDGKSLESAKRTGYVLDGWYTDPAFKHRFLFKSPVSDSTPDVAWDYQENRWASTRAAYGDDAEKRDNVRGILFLYAKWVLDASAMGIHVIYDPGDAAIYDSRNRLLTTVPVDKHLYGFDDAAIAREAPSNYSDLYAFKCWEATKLGGATAQYHPGERVNLAELKPTDPTYDEESGKVIHCTVLVRAVYDTVGDSSHQKTIVFDGNTFEDALYNGTTREMRGRAKDGQQRHVITLDNKAKTIELPDAGDFLLDGWGLVGWSFTKGDYSAQAAARTKSSTFAPGQKVAVDKLVSSEAKDVRNTLYAMWRPKKYSVTIKQVIEDGVPVNDFAYAYKTGSEKAIASAPETVQSLSGNSSFAVSDGLELYERVGSVIRVKAPQIADAAPYSVRASAAVTSNGGKTETLYPTAAGDYQILGDVAITYTYSPRVQLTFKKRDAADHANVLTGAVFAVTPVELNASTQQWEPAETGTEITVTGASVEHSLQEGTYRIVETTAPAGYAPIGTDLFLMLKKDQAATLSAAGGGAVAESIAELDGAGAVLTVYDNPIRTIKLSNTVIGPDKQFAFKATVFNDDTSRLSDYALATFDGKTLVTNKAGELTLQLSNGRSVDFEIPHGCKLKVEETSDSMYETSYAWNGAQPVEGTAFGADPIAITADGTLAFENKRIPAPTGVAFENAPYQAALLAGAVLLLLAVAPAMSRRRGRN